MSEKKVKLSRKQAIQKLWEMGDLTYLLRGVQREMRDSVYNSRGKKTVFLASRRLGKTFTMCTISVEFCIKNPNQIVKLIFPKKKDAQQVARFQMKEILNDCPPHMKPEWKEAQKLFVFPNGSEIQMAGTDGGSAESVRGSAAHLILLDESGFHDYNDFEYIVNSILMPTLLTTKGKLIMASTPSKEPDHPFMVQYVEPARHDGSLVEFDIYSNPMITEDMIDEIAEEYPLGKEDPSFKREFLLISESDHNLMVVPEFTKDVKNDIVKSNPVPAHYDAYVSGDPAVTDLTGILFGYYDFLQNKLIIMDELVMGGKGQKSLTTSDIADGVRRKEKILFQNPLTGEVQEPYLRLMDNNNLILINDLYKEHGLRFIPTKKDKKREQVNKLRMMLRKGDILIDPKCKNLIYHLETTRWKFLKNGTATDKFDHSKGVQGKFKAHHGDLVDALLYMVRNVQFSKNPYPDDWQAMSGENVFQSRYQETESELSRTFKGVMNMKDKRK